MRNWLTYKFTFPYHSFTPYITLGVGAFTFDPYAYLNGKKEFLRPLGTEGQLIGYNGRKPYNTLAISIPLGVGAISAYYNFAFAEQAPGIVINAVGLTFGTAIAMYLLYSFKIIKATAKFRAIVVTATAGIAVFYLIAWVLSFFGISIPFLHEGSALGIGFSVFVVALAALNLILDFDMIEKGAELGAPKYMEWYGAFGLLVTIVWLYLEILRLLSKISKK